MRILKSGKLWIGLAAFLLIGSMVGYLAQLWVSPKNGEEPGVMKYPLQVTDQGGHEVTIPKRPERIVSLIPSHTELAFALGLGEKVIGVTNNDNYPAEVKEIPKVGDMKINVGKLVQLQPDLVLVSSLNGDELIRQLKKLELPVLVLDAENIKGIYQSIDILSQATNQTHQADELIKQMEEEIRTVAKKVASIPEGERKKVWIEISPDLHTAGKATLVNEVIQLAGGENIVKEEGYPQLSAETVIAANPDLILSVYGEVDTIKQRSAWSVIQAMKKNQVHSMDPDIINRSGPRITQAIQQIAAYLYPELM